MTSWNELVQVATQVAQETGYPLNVLLGQAYQETSGNPANAPGNNWFGIKGSGTAGSQNLATKEQGAKGLYGTRSNFAKFNTIEDAVSAYFATIEKLVPNWKQLANNPVQLVQAIKNAGYATDNDYVADVTNNPGFRNYGEVQAQPQYDERLTQTTYDGKTWKFNNQTQKYEQPGIIPTSVPSQQYTPTLNKSITSPVSSKTVKPDIWETIKNLIVPQVYGQETYSPVSPPLNQYTVRAGDTLWGIAQNTLGSGNRWRELQGYVGSPTTMPIGTRITIPTSSQVPKPAPNTSTRQGAVYSPPPKKTLPPLNFSLSPVANSTATFKGGY